MSRAAVTRQPAEPRSAKQQERYARMLRAAGRLGAQHGLERMQMHDVAREAGVAIATLYRYFLPRRICSPPSCTTGSDGSTPSPSPPPWLGPVEAVSELLVRASGQLFEQPLLALAMMQSNNAAFVGGGTTVRQTDEIIRDLLLRTASVDCPSGGMCVSCASWSRRGTASSPPFSTRSSPEAAYEGIRLACRLLLAPVPARRP
ncbi:TetR family transcriptional regulator [Streptomyces sp. M10(2022)]